MKYFEELKHFIDWLSKFCIKSKQNLYIFLTKGKHSPFFLFIELVYANCTARAISYYVYRYSM